MSRSWGMYSPVCHRRSTSRFRWTLWTCYRVCGMYTDLGFSAPPDNDTYTSIVPALASSGLTCTIVSWMAF